VDRFAFQAKKGERLLVQVRSKALGMPLDASLRIESSDGKVLASNDDQGENPDPMAAFNAPAEGTYQAVVSDLFGKGGAMHGYVVEIGAERPEIEVSLTSVNGVVLAAGKTADVTAKVKRLGNLSGPLAACIEGLPPGVLAETAMVDEKKGEVKVTLSASANAPSSSGPIVLSVFVKDGKPMTHRTALFALRGETKRGTSLLDESDQIWLTLTPGKPEVAKKTPLPVIGAVPK
jgi:Bacterial pre-peptidase C-terminal domain